MITEFFLDLLGLFASAAFLVLPESSLGINASLQDISQELAELLGPLDAWLPLSELLLCLVVFVNVWIPVVLTYVIANWIYRHIPVFGGGG